MEEEREDEEGVSAGPERVRPGTLSADGGEMERMRVWP